MELAKFGGWTIFKKLLIFSVVLVVLPLGIFGFVGSFYFSNAIEDQVKFDLINSVQGKIDILTQAIADTKRESKIVADLDAAKSILSNLYNQSGVDQSEHLEEVYTYLAEVFKESNGLYENLFFVDSQGIIVADGKHGEAIGIDVSDMNFYHGVERTGAQFLGDVMESPVTGRPVIVLGTPVAENGHKIGVFCASIEFNKLTEMLIKRSEGVNYNYGIFNKDGVTIAHEDQDKIFNLDFKSHTGGLNVVYERAVKGDAGIEKYTLDGVKKILAFDSFSENDWTVFAASRVTDYMNPIQRINQVMLLIGLVCLAVAVSVGFIFSRTLAKPLQNITEVIGQVSEGDLTVQVNEVKLKDEIGQLNQYFKAMLINLRGVITNVVDETQTTNQSSLRAQNAFKELQSAVENISATVEEISAGMEESASATQEVAASSQSINSSIDDMAVKAQTGAKQAKEMLVRAKELRGNATTSKANTEKVLRENQSKLLQAVRDAEVVKEIERLTSSILTITNQTNLLALNAAIEAARAGDAGKGFAVVADEIRELAEESAVAAGDIQNVTKQVTSSVQNLIQSSNKLLDFIDHEVAEDYDMLGKTAEQYDDDARLVAETMEEFSTTSERLAEMVGQVARAINEISGVINEGADGANAISTNITTVVEKADEVGQLAEDSQESAKRLETLVSQFKI